MPKQVVRIEGLRELDAALGDLKKATARAVLRRVLLKAAQPMVETARQLAPDDPNTGPPDLHSSIEASSRFKNTVGNAEFAAVMEGGGSRSEAASAMRDARRGSNMGSFAEVAVGPVSTTKRAAIKAIVQEFGSVKQAPHPYMRPAFEQHKNGVLDIVKTELGGEINKAAARAAARAARLAAKGS